CVLLVLREIEARSVRDALELTETGRGEREAILHIARARPFTGVVRELIAVVLAHLQTLTGKSQAAPPAHAFLAPEGVPRVRLARVAEELDLHLLELAAAEGEVPRRHLVAKRLADLGDTERHFHSRRVEDVLELHEDPLRGLGPQVG